MHRDMEQQAAAYEIGGGAPEDDHEFAEEHEPNEVYVIVADTDIDYALGQEGHDELQRASDEQREEYPEEMGAIATHVFPEECGGGGARVIFVAYLSEFLGRLEEHGDSLLPVAVSRRDPMPRHLFTVAGIFPFSGVGDMEAPAIPADPVKHHEMVLVPMEYAGEGSIG